MHNYLFMHYNMQIKHIMHKLHNYNFKNLLLRYLFIKIKYLNNNLHNKMHTNLCIHFYMQFI